MSIHYRTQAFVLAKSERREADQVFSVFSQNFGSLRILGKATRKITSKLRPAIPLFSLANIAFIQGRAYKTLTDATLIGDFPSTKRDLKKLRIAWRISEVFNQLVKPPQKDQKIWQLLNEVFRYLDNYQLPTTNYQLAYHYFLWNLLAILGHKPELYECLVCRNKLEPNNLYFSGEGGIVCDSCYNIKQEAVETSPDTVKIIREILKRELPHLLRIKLKKEHYMALEKISDFYVSAILSQN